MKNLILIITILFNLNIYSQLTSIVSDEFNDEIYSNYDEHGTLKITCTKTQVILILDLDGNLSQHKPITLTYNLISDIYLKWSEHNQYYNIMVLLEKKGTLPMAGVIDISNNSILLFYQDNTSLLYIGEGVIITI